MAPFFATSGGAVLRLLHCNSPVSRQQHLVAQRKSMHLPFRWHQHSEFQIRHSCQIGSLSCWSHQQSTRKAAGSSPAQVMVVLLLLERACCDLSDVAYLQSTSQVPVAQWIRRVTTNHEIGGSNPSGDVSEDGLVGYDDCLTRSRSRVRSSVLVCFEAMAQRQRVGFQTRRLGVQIPLASIFDC